MFSNALASPLRALPTVFGTTMTLLILPMTIIGLVQYVFDIQLHWFTLSPATTTVAATYGLASCTPHGAMVAALMDDLYGVNDYLQFPPLWAIALIMVGEV